MAIVTEDKTFMALTGQRLPTTSRLRMFPILREWNDENFINIFRSYIVNERITSKDDYWIDYVVEPDDWWDSISSKHYETPTLWWCICIVNGINNPFEELEEGLIIKVIKNEYLYVIFNDLNRLSML